MSTRKWSLGLTLAAAAVLAACGAAKPPAAATPAPGPSPYIAVARGRIDVEGGLLRQDAPREGRITRVLVQEGQHVRRGQRLIDLDDTSARLAVAAAAAGVREAGAQLQALLAQLGPAGTRAERLRAAAKAGAGEGQLADDAEAQVQQLEAQRDVALAARSAAETRLAVEKHELAVLTITAAQDAVVTQVLAQPGGQVSPASGPLLALLPDTPHIVRAELSESYADAVRPQMRALVSLEDDPGQGWPAHVLRISPIVGPARLEEDEQRRAVERTVECVLAFDGDTPLRVGQRVLARIGAP
jgi:multidrug efflux pump subunit AcrA (membrane-fusion protein)